MSILAQPQHGLSILNMQNMESRYIIEAQLDVSSIRGNETKLSIRMSS